MKKFHFWVAPLLSIFLVFFSYQAPAISEVPLRDVASYDELVSAIRATRAASQARIEAAVEQEKVREAWETGKLIDEHILLQKERQKYGEQVVERLARDLEMDKSEITRMVEFARAYPIDVPGHQLSWAHYKALLAVNEAGERENLAVQAEKENWNRDQVWDEVRKRKKPSSSPTESFGYPELPEIKPGPLNTYQIIRLKDRLKIDLGFGIFHDLPEKDAKTFKEGDIIHAPSSLRGEAEAISVLENASASDLFTYAATVTQVVDGDTFHALIDLGFGDTLAQRVRLRRIDAPEILSAEGKEAKAYLEKILSRAHGRILVKSIDIDQHGRPIADVWVCSARSDQASADGTRTTRDECKNKPVDQELLDKGYAVRISE